MDTPHGGALTGLLWALPWLAFAVLVAVRVREPWPLPEVGAPPGANRNQAGGEGDAAPHVTVIIPARDESRSIQECVGSILASDYPEFDVVLVDDRSTDGTAELARATATNVPGGEARLTVVSGKPLPPGWFGKPWACVQGYRAARGELLLFTDADTWHEPELLRRCVAAFRAHDLDALTLMSRQRMETFWERVVQPQIFFMIGFRYGNVRRLFDPVLEAPARWRDAIANGQFIMATRTAYEGVGTHETVAHEVVEDLRLAQEVAKAGKRLALLDPGNGLQTRMYRSFSDILEGWTKNLWTGSRQAFTGPLTGLLPWAAAFGMLGFWWAPLVAIAWAWFGAGGAEVNGAIVGGPAWVIGAYAAVALSAAFWCVGFRRFKAPALYGLTYPLGVAVTAWLLMRSSLRGGRIEWKGRRYGADGSGAAPDGPADPS